MSSPCTSACSAWASVDDICEPCDTYTTDLDLLDSSLAIASDLLFEMSGRRFPGSCSETVRPCGRSYHDGDIRGYHMDSGRPWYGTCGCQGGCGCSRLSEVSLGGYPVTSVSEVKVDGVTLDAARYRVDDWKWLVRLDDADGNNPGWPCCPSLLDDPDDTDGHAFEVTFTYGTAPPPAGVRAAAVLACELVLACEPDQANQCRIPRKARSIVRQGVSMELMVEGFDFLRDGRTGIWEIDVFLQAYNPARISRPMAVVSPDIAPRVRRVGT